MRSLSALPYRAERRLGERSPRIPGVTQRHAGLAGQHRRSALCLLAYIYLAVAVALDRDTHADLEIGLIPVTVPEMLRMLRGTVISPPRRDPRPPPALVAVATPPPVASQPSPPALECLRRCHTVITTNYRCRNYGLTPD